MSQAAGQSVALACQAMGTRFELLLPFDEAVATPRLRAAGEAAIDEIARWHSLLSAFDPASVVSRINRGAATQPVLVPAEVAGLLSWCKEVSAASRGAFDPSVGLLMRAAGFRGNDRETAAIRALPEAMSGVELEEGDGAWRVRFTSSDVALDFGAVGKGWAIDRALDVLREQGVTRALLHGGTSSVAAIGDSGAGPWRIGTGEGGGVFKLVNGSLGISSPSGRTVSDAQGVVHGHVLDPRSGKSAAAAGGVVVGGPDCALCDAWSTALLVEPGLISSDSWPAGYSAMIYHEPAGWRVYDSEGQFAGEPASKQGNVH